MSYTTLWDRFLDVRAFWTENKKLLDEVSNFIKEKAELDRQYGKGLERLSKLPLFERVFGTIAPTLSGLKSFYSEISQHLIGHSDYMLEEIYTKLKKIAASHESLIQDHKQNGQKLVLEREKILKHHTIIRNKYWKSCKENEALAGKINSKSIQTEESHHKAYVNAINQVNLFNLSFVDGINKVLTTYQEQNLEKLQATRNALQVFVAGDASTVYSMKMHLDHLPVAIDTFNPEVDQRMFVGSTFTGRQVEDVNFISYAQSLSIRTFSGQIDQENDDEFLATIGNCWKGVPLNDESKKFFEVIIAQDHGKKKFITCLNEKRKNGEFKIPDHTFKDLGALFFIALNNFNDLEDLSLAKQCIILSQTFYAGSQDMEKIYLQTLIFEHPLWKKEDYWEFMVDNAVENALDSLNEFGDEIDIKQDLEEKKRSVICSALISYSHMMGSFNVEKERVISVLMKAKEKYQLSDSDLPMTDLASFFN